MLLGPQVDLPGVVLGPDAQDKWIAGRAALRLMTWLLPARNLDCDNAGSDAKLIYLNCAYTLLQIPCPLVILACR